MDEKAEGRIYTLRPSGGGMRLCTPGSDKCKAKEIANGISEDDAKKAVEEYWADKTPAG